jgi:hypothetical protein
MTAYDLLWSSIDRNSSIRASVTGGGQQLTEPWCFDLPALVSYRFRPRKLLGYNGFLRPVQALGRTAPVWSHPK